MKLTQHLTESEDTVSSAASRFAQAKLKSGGNHINPGQGVVTVKALKFGTKPEFFNGTTFVAEFIVQSCEPYEGIQDENGKAKPAGNKPGTQVTWLKTMGDFEEMFWDDVYTFLVTLMGETEASIAASAADRAASIKKDPKMLRELELKIGTPVKGEWGPSEESALLFESAIDRNENPMKGVNIAYRTYEKTARKSGKKITLVAWDHIPQTPEEIAERAAKL